MIRSAFISPRKQGERGSRGVRERGREYIYQVGQRRVPSGFARDQAGVCCDSPWVTTISCFIHNVAFPRLINARPAINDSHKTPSRLWLLPFSRPKKGRAVKLHFNPQEKARRVTSVAMVRRKKLQSCCQTNKRLICMRSRPHYCTTTGPLHSSFLFLVYFSSPGIGKYRLAGEVCCYFNSILLCGSSKLSIIALARLSVCDRYQFRVRKTSAASSLFWQREIRT